MPESFFNYNLTRPYPYRWFTWVVVIGGLAATALFSVISLAADGYNLITVFSVDPNATIAKTQWFQKHPWSLTSNPATSCQPETFAVGSQLMTSSSTTLYTLTGVEAPDHASQATLPYLNNVIEDCQLSSVSLTWTNQSAGYFSGVNPLSASLVCTITSEAKYTIFLDIDMDGTGPYTYFLVQGGQDFLPKGSILVGSLISASIENFQNLVDSSSLLGGLYGDMCVDLCSDIAQLYIGGNISDAVDVLNVDNFALWTSIIYLDHQVATDLEALSFINNAVELIFALVVSGIRTDLGQNSSNLFADPSTIVQFLQEFSLPNSYGIPPPAVNMSMFYANQAAPIPTIDQTTFATRYLCQVPQLKPTGSLVISIIVADLVFLQTLWMVFNWAVTSNLEHRHHEAKFCQGCATGLPENYSATIQTDPAAQVEVGKSPGVKVSAMPSKLEPAGEEEATTKRPERAVTT